MTGSYADVLDSPALGLILSLERAGVSLRVDGERVLARPLDLLTSEQRERLRTEREAIAIILRLYDDGVQRRREAFAAQLARGGDVVLPVLVYVPNVPYTRGVCYSCGERLELATFGRCWRCSLAWRLACGVPLPNKLAAVLDEARAV